MISPDVRKKYRATIGIECHVQLKTKTKLFSAVGNDAREAPPNTLVSHIDFGLPGALPVLNKEAIHLATRAAFALGTEPQHFSKFDRKHYFYPDLPKGYQISQYDEPIIDKGAITIDVKGEPKQIGITRAHLEEDAGKSTHQAGKDYSLVDLNRAGTPLLEIVSEPDMHTSAEAKAYVHELYLRMRYADVSDANLFYGNMRFDVNVSVSQTDELGTRSETKNLNSFRAVEKAVDYEINRQIELLEKGQKVVQETRGWDDAKQKTLSQRSKENADDYRYMPDPDLPPIIIEQDYIEKIKKEMPVMPEEWRRRLNSLGIAKPQMELLLEANLEFGLESERSADIDLEWYGYLQPLATCNDQTFAKRLADWFINIEIPFYANANRVWVAPLKNRKEFYADANKLVQDDQLSSTNAKQLLTLILTQSSVLIDSEEYQNLNEDWDLPSVKDVANRAGLIQVSDEGEIAKIVEQVLAENTKAAEDVKNGEMKAIGFLVGQVMKLSQGKANPQLAHKLIKQQLQIQ